MIAKNHRSELWIDLKDPKLKKWIERQAEKVGLSTTSWVRMQLIKIKKETGEDEAKTAAYVRKGDWSEYSIHHARTGWIVEFNSRIQGEVTSRRILVYYDNRATKHHGYNRMSDLNGEHSEGITIGDYIAHIAQDASKSKPSHPDFTETKYARTLDKGTEVK